MKRKRMIIKRGIALMLAISILPFQSLEGIFPLTVYAAESSEALKEDMTEEAESELSLAVEGGRTLAIESETTEEAESETTEATEVETTDSYEETTEETEAEETSVEVPTEPSMETPTETSTETTVETETETVTVEETATEERVTEETAEEKGEFEITGKLDEKGIVQLEWNLYEDETFTYEVYRNEELLSGDAVALEETVTFCDEQLEAGITYIYRVSVINEQGESVCSSEPVTIEIPQSLAITSDYTLTDDLAVFELQVSGGTLNLNGYELTVYRDIVQSAGVVKINAGTLKVGGDYRMQSRYGEEGAYTFGKSTGLLQMTQEEDYVLVKGSFRSVSNTAQTGYLTAGTLEIQGDMVVSSQYSSRSFMATGSHRVLLSGEEKQTVSFGACRQDYSRLCNLEILNESEEGIVITDKPYVSGHVKDHGNRVSGYIAIGDDTTFENDRFEGSIYIGQTVTLDGVLDIGDDMCLGGYLYLSGQVRVRGNYKQVIYGSLIMSGGKLEVEGDFTLSDAYKSMMQMKNERDYIHVHGNVDYVPYYYGYLQAGTFEVGGNLTASGIRATDSHRFLFSGDSLQVIRLGEKDYFATVELHNDSEEGVYSETVFAKTTLIRNGCRLVYGDVEGEYGFTLQEDMEYEGDLVLLEDTLDLNGHALTVKGDLVQLSGIVTINGGSLTVEGDYRMQSRTGEEDHYTYGKSSGLLQMTKEEDRVCIKGSFLSDTSADSTGYLTEGILEIQGDVVINNAYSNKGFVATGNHTLVLEGTEKQTVSFGAYSYGYSQVRGLEIINQSEEGVYIPEKIYVTGPVNDHGNMVTGTIRIGAETTFEGGNFSGSVYVGESVTLDDTVTIGGDLTLGGSTILTGKVHVKGDVTHQYNGQLSIGNGSLEVDGNYDLAYANYSALSMYHGDAYFHVHGDMTYTPYRTNTLTAGTLEIGGNLTSYGKFQASGSHKVVFSGNGRQVITVTDKDYFATVELKNYSDEGVYAETFFTKQAMIRNGCKITYKDITGEYGFTLEEDMVYEGNLVLLEDTLDLNGHSLTITGDLIQQGGIVNVNGGNLTVEGDYRLQSRTGEEGAYTYGKSTGLLQMQQEKDHVLVKGSFYSDSATDSTGYLSAGTMEIQGDMVVNSTYSEKNFVATGNHTLLLSGKTGQSISFGKSDSYTSRLQNLEITNGSEEGVLIQENPYVTGHVNDHEKKVSGSVSIGKNTSFEKDTFGGSIYIGQNMIWDDAITIGENLCLAASVSLSGKVHVKGNVTHDNRGQLQMYKGSLLVDGNYSVEKYGCRGITMNYEEDYIHVYGDVKNAPYYGSTQLNGGTFEIGGNLTSSWELRATGSHRFLFSGDNRQVINIAKNDYFATIELKNYSDEGVYSDTTFVKTTLIRNGCRLTYGDQVGEFGWTLQEDQVYEGDLVLIEDTLDLNGHSLTVTGDFIQLSGAVKINGGSLTVEGDYRMQSRSGEEGAYTYGKSSGLLQMTESKDYVLVKGSYLSDSAADSTGYLTDGTLEIQGDMVVNSTYSKKSFVAGENHTLLLSGDGKQSLGITDGGETLSRLQNLEITKKSEEGIVITDTPYIAGHVNDGGNHVSGSIAIGTDTTFENGRFGGGVHIGQLTTLDEELTIEGDLNIAGRTWLSGKVYVKGDCTHDTYGDLRMNKGSLTVEGDYTCAYKTNVRLTMTHTEDSIHVHGDVNYNPYYGNIFSAGTFEIGGNLTSKGKFWASGSHTLLLSGSAKQVLDLEKNDYFATVELQNHSEEGVYCQSVFPKTKLIRNGCKLTYGDITGEFGWTLSEDQIYEGDLVLIEDTLDLNGHSLTVKGDLIQLSGTVKINGGNLTVEGDYRLQSRTGSEGSYRYGVSSGTLLMEKGKDHVTICGDFILKTSTAFTGNITAGTLELKGNFTQLGTTGYEAGGDSTLLFTGEKKQTWEAEATTKVGHVINRNKKELVLGSVVDVTGSITDETGTVSGTGCLNISSISRIENGSFSGNICLTKEYTLTREVKLGGLSVGTEKNEVTLHTAGHSIHAGSITLHGTLDTEDANVVCTGNFSVEKNGKLIMKDSDAYVLTGGNFRMSSKYNHKGQLSAGTLEVQGHFTQNSNVNFVADGEHTVILSGKKTTEGRNIVQNVLFDYEAGTTRFHKLILTRNMESYVFRDEPENIADEVIYAPEDTTAPGEVSFLKTTSVTSQAVTLSYGKAEDESGILGYEIFRDGKKVGTTGKESYTDSGLVPGTEYIYRVYAVDTYHNRATKSPKVTVTTAEDDEAPATPDSLSVYTRTGSSITLTWNPATDNVGVTGYRLYRDGEAIATGLEKTEYQDRNLEKNKVYKYSVAAEDAQGNVSGTCEPIEATVAMPGFIKITPEDYSRIGGDSVSLTAEFENVGNATGNRVKIEYQSDGGEWNLLTPSLLTPNEGNDRSFLVRYNWNIKALLGEQDYHVRYTLYDADGNTDVEEVTYHIDKEAPKQPEGFAVTNKDGVAVLSWEASVSGDCGYYKLYRRTGEETEATLLTTLKGRYENYFEDIQVEAGRDYTYTIVTGDGFGNESEASKPVTVTIGEDKAAPKIKNITPKAGKVSGITGLTITASDNKGVAEVSLKYKEEENQEWTALTRPKTTNGVAVCQWDTTTLKDGVYILAATAVDTSGNESTTEFTRRYEVDNTGIGKIEITDYTAHSTGVQICWKDVTEEDFGYFQVERLMGETWTKIATVTDKLGYNVTGLLPDTEYTFRVVGYDALDNRGEPSDALTVVTAKDSTAPVIKVVGPVATDYKDTIALEVQAEDNHAIDRAVFSYSTDQKTFEELAVITADKKEKTATLSYIYDITDSTEGPLYIRFEVYDVAGNKNAPSLEGEDIVVEYHVDHTAPGKVEELTTTGEEGYVGLDWSKGADKDIASYRIYRADAKTGIFEILEKKWEARSYFDTAVEAGESYIYKVSAVDMAGNEGECSKEIPVTVKPDKEAPVITGMSPKTGGVVGKDATMEILAMDNAGLKEIRLEYRAKDSTQELWTRLDVESVSGRSYLARVNWNTEGLSEGEYLLRATAMDMAGNSSNPYPVTYTLDLSAPKAPVLTAKTGHFEILLEMEGGKEEDFAYYEIYRKTAGEKDYKRITTCTENTYTDTGVKPDVMYHYQVAAYDKYGNVSRSEEKQAYADDKDVVAPKAQAPENLMSLVGMEMTFDGMGSTDNVRVKTYEWDMGNGDVIKGAQPRYAYTEPGTYTVTLKVSDGAGNTDTANTTVYIYEKDGKGITKVKVTDTAGNAIPYAVIYMKLSETEHLSLQADGQGYVDIVSDVGACTVAAYANGYLPDDITILISEYETKEYTLPLTEDELIVGEMNVRRMTLEEMAEAGVDFSDPRNYHSYVFSVKLTFAEFPEVVDIVYGGGLDVRKDQKITFYGSKYKKGKGGGGDFQAQVIEQEEDNAEPPQPVLAYIYTRQSISWLKEMYEVDLGILNAADSEYVIEDSSATLNLPESGVSLAKTNVGQSLTKEMGSIRGQEKKNVSWVIKGDKSGTYEFSADFKGNLMPFMVPVSAHFETKQELSVSTGEGIHIYVMPENRAYIGESYYIQFKVVNESSRPIYNFSTSIGPYRAPMQKYTVKNMDTGEVTTQYSGEFRIADPSQISQSVVVQDGQKLTFSVLNPGDCYYGTYSTVFSAATESEPDEVYYKLIDYLVKTLEGENLGVEVSVAPVSSHISRYSWKYVEIPVLYGDPIDMSTGYFTDEMTAFTINGVVPLTLDMTYSSGNTDEKGEMGYGWYHNYEMNVEQKNGIIEFHISPGTSATFINKNALNHNLFGSAEGEETILSNSKEFSYGEYTSLSAGMEKYSLYRNTDGTYTMKLPNNGEYIFNKNGRLTKIKDSEGKTISLSYSSGKTTVTEEVSGKKIYLSYNDEGLLKAVYDDNDRKTTFTYEGEKLTGVTSPIGETVNYTYDDSNHIVSESNSGGTFVQNEYDSEGRVTRQTDAVGNVMKLSYDVSDTGMTITVDEADTTKQTVVDRYGRIVKVVNANGSTTEYAYDSKGNVICEEDAYGNVIFKEYDAKGNLTKLTDTAGKVTSMGYDTNGNVTSIEGAGDRNATYTYDGRNLQTSATDFSGKKTTYTYDTKGQLIREAIEGLGAMEYTYKNGLPVSITDYNGNTSYSEYDGAGNLIKTVDAMGGVTTYTYDKAGYLLSTTDSMGNTTTYRYDCNGNVTSETDALGNTTSYAYDKAGRQTKITYPDGTSTRYSYDSMGNCTKTTYADGTSDTYTYDSMGNVICETLADGSTKKYSYDLLNQCISETDAEGNTISHEYYPNGSLYKNVYPDGTYELYTYNDAWKVSNVRDRSGNATTYEYDAMGNVTMVRDALGNATSYSYDKYGRLVKETDPNGNSTTYAYDGNGNCVSKTNALGVRVSMSYDVLNRMTRVVTVKDGEEYSISYTYDSLGRVLTSTDEEGNTISYSYDAKGNVLSTTDAEETVIAASTYDSMNRVNQTTDALGVSTQYSYSETGNLLGAVEQLNEQTQRTTTYTYDTLGRMTSVTDAMGGVTSATYDKRGNVSSITDANGGTTKYSYDSMGQMIAQVSPLGSRHNYSYNAMGLLKEQENARGQKTTYTYDAAGRITSMKDELGTVKYTYDKNGNVLTVTDSQGTITRQYDALNRVTEYTDYKGDTVKYSYDELGNLIALTYPGGEIVRYTYYKNGWLHTVTDTEGMVTSYEYDGNGNLTHTIRPNGTEEICTYNKAGLLVSQKDIKGEEVLTEYVYTYDESGNVTTIDGTETTDTKLGIKRLESAKMTYDAENRLLTYNGEELRYDADGNMTYGPVNGVMSEITYDCRNRLISAGGITYTYDAENNRIQAETDEYVEKYFTDTVSSSLSRVLMVTRYEKKVSDTADSEGEADVLPGTGNTTIYVYGYGLISETTGDITLYHHYNNLGSTMKLTDATGRVMATYTYGTYGELLSGDTSLTRFLYNGRCGVTTDDNGLYYMRQRYYNPDIKRFLNQDILTGSIDNSQSLNRYSYVQGNPVSYTDPFGLSPLNGLFSDTALPHAILGLISCAPGPAGIIATALDGLLYYFVDGTDEAKAMALMCAVSIFVPAGLRRFARSARCTANAARLIQVAGLVFNGITFLRNARTTVNGIRDMWQDYVVNGKEVGVHTWVEGLTLLTAAIGTAQAGKGAWDSGKSLASIQGTCFIAGTEIVTQTGNQNIEEIEVGEYVYAKNVLTGETGYKKVLQVFVRETTELIHIKVGEEELVTTYTHPFWVEGYGFKVAGELEKGDLVESLDGSLEPVTDVETEYLETPVPVYNFEVEDWHTYYVSDAEILVHNANYGETVGNESGRYTKTNYEGTTKVGGQERDISRTVYQRNDIDWNRVDSETGLTNKQLAQAGLAPYANDGTKIELHHLLQQEPGPMVEIPGSLHDKYYKPLHGLVGDGESFRNNPDLEKQYNNFRAKYWRWRAQNL